MQGQMITPTRQLSRQEGVLYFVPKKIANWTWIVASLGLVLFVGGAGSSNILLLSIGVLLLLVSILAIVRVLTSNPTDEQYDQWVEEQANRLYYRGLEALGIDRKNVTDTLRIHSFVLPGSQAANQYASKEVRMRLGRDQQWRFSVNVYTYFFLTRHYVGIYRADVNVFHPTAPIEQKVSYNYFHIVSATTSQSRDTVIINKKSLQYRLERFCLELSTGRTVELSAAVKAVLLERTANAPASPLPKTGFDRTLSRLTHLLLSKGSPPTRP
ncbi:MAG: hypothetical protein JOZ18_06105 [Chloroflexi bacterium]|nr:hypothetical protein [Chloroflexota bacterium]